jgi:hypothetical protein
MPVPRVCDWVTYGWVVVMCITGLCVTTLFVGEATVDRIGFYTLVTTFAALALMGDMRTVMPLDAYRMACVWYFWLAYGAYLGLTHMHLNVPLGYVFSVAQLLMVALSFSDAVAGSRALRLGLGCTHFMLLLLPNQDALVHEAPLALTLVRIVIFALLWVAAVLADTRTYDLFEHPYRRLVRAGWALFVSRWALVAAPVIFMLLLGDARHVLARYSKGGEDTNEQQRGDIEEAAEAEGRGSSSKHGGQSPPPPPLADCREYGASCRAENTPMPTTRAPTSELRPRVQTPSPPVHAPLWQQQGAPLPEPNPSYHMQQQHQQQWAPPGADLGAMGGGGMSQQELASRMYASMAGMDQDAAPGMRRVLESQLGIPQVAAPVDRLHAEAAALAAQYKTGGTAALAPAPLVYGHGNNDPSVPKLYF